jgi:2-polyprenyl-6-methoxyphenol hydroxylase-like FAD-dependent oxidoreductase
LPNDRADALLALDERAFEQALLEATGGAAGSLTLASPRASWPLSLARARACCGPGWVLLGDAAHVVHPLAGQGLNLGLADVATLARVIAEREPWRDVGDEKLLRRYSRERRAPTWAMGQLTDGLLQLFAHPTPAVRELRNRGLTLVNHLGLVKRWLTARALDS